MNTLPAPSHIVGSKWFLSGKTKWIGVERAKMVRNRKDADASVATASSNSSASASASASAPVAAPVALPNVVEVVVMDEPSEQELRIAALEAQVAEARAEIARLRASSARFAELLAAAAAAASF